MGASILSNNLNALRTGNPSLAQVLDTVERDSSYTSCIESRSGHCIPCYKDGTPANSRFDPVSEAARITGSIPDGSFVLFLGITGGFHIRAFLDKNPECSCALAETSLPALKALLSLIPLEDLLCRKNVYLLPDCQPDTIIREVPQIYLPVLHGSFFVFSPRSWEDRFFLDSLRDAVTTMISIVSADYSVQAHFGKIWFINAVKNLAVMDTLKQPSLRTDSSKTAIIAAAGPTLESHLPEIRNNRSTYVIFSTDTAFGTLRGYGIVPDYYVTIDPQFYSSLHLFHAITNETTIIADFCAHPSVIHKALSAGAPVTLAAGKHPLAQTAAAFSPLPHLETASGTVTAAARSAAHAMGYDTPCVIGADFAYVHGKPYARDTYLSLLFGANSSRMDTAETSFVALMFRTEVETRHTGRGFTYIPPIMTSYKKAFEEYLPSVRWNKESPAPFPAKAFLEYLTGKLKEYVLTGNPDPVFEKNMLPFFAWYQKHYKVDPCQKTRKKAIQLALDIIAGYTDLS